MISSFSWNISPFEELTTTGVFIYSSSHKAGTYTGLLTTWCSAASSPRSNSVETTLAVRSLTLTGELGRELGLLLMSSHRISSEVVDYLDSGRTEETMEFGMELAKRLARDGTPLFVFC
jgi:hypothetical protein